jgi:hypothetical protein
MWSAFENANLTASVRTANILSGDINEFITVPSMVFLYNVASAAGVHMTMFADSDVAIDNKEIVAIGTSLIKPDHLLDSFAVGAGTRLSLFADERAAAATTDLLTGVEVIPL